MLKCDWTLEYFAERKLQPEDGHLVVPTMDLFEWMLYGFRSDGDISTLENPYSRTLIVAEAITRVSEMDDTFPAGLRCPPKIWCSYIPHPEDSFGECRYFILFKFENNGNSYLFELHP